MVGNKGVRPDGEGSTGGAGGSEAILSGDKVCGFGIASGALLVSPRLSSTTTTWCGYISDWIKMYRKFQPVAFWKKQNIF